MKKKYSSEQIFYIFIIFSSILISGFQFLYNRSLWLDEASLALNIINKSYFELFSPLVYDQVAPILYLLITKFFANLFFNTEYGLRLFPLLCFWTSIFLFAKIIKKLFNNYQTLIFALSLFVFNTTLIYYSSETKQYMTDVFVLLVLYFLIFKNYDPLSEKIAKYDFYLTGIFGTISLFLSNVAPVILATLGIYFLFNYFFVEQKDLGKLSGIAIAWSTAFALVFVFFIYDNPVKHYMVFFWENSNAFMPKNPFSQDFYYFILDKVRMVFLEIFNFGRICALFLKIFFISGLIILLRKKKAGILILTVFPVIIHLLLSAFKLYPFHSRLILYFCPLIIIICSYGFEYFHNLLPVNINFKDSLILPAAITVFMFFNISRSGFPFEHEEIKKSIIFIEQHNDKKIPIYVYHEALRPFKYYREINFIDGYKYIFSNNKVKNLNEIKKLKGPHWLLFSHSLNYEEDLIINWLDSHGFNKIKEYKGVGSDTYLYNFSL
jgi:hypothetical protein